MTTRKRRGRGEGGIRERADGTWEATVSLGTKADGSRDRRSFYGDTKKEAIQKRDEFMRLNNFGEYLKGADGRLDGYLLDWLDTRHHRGDLSPTSYDRYEGLLRLHILPVIGQVALSKLDERAVYRVLDTMARNGESSSSQRQAEKILRGALNRAVREKVLNRNPCNDIIRTKVSRREIRPFSEEQCQALLAAVSRYRMRALLRLALGTGMRQGEMLALSWPDVDLDRGDVHVRHTLVRVRRPEGGMCFLRKAPKSKASLRTIRVAASVVDALREHRAAMLREGNIKAPVFCTRTGNFTGKDSLVRDFFKPLLKRAGLDGLGFRFHDLRHSHATILLRRGNFIKAVSRRLGHSNVKTTLDIYAHVCPEDDGMLAVDFESALSAKRGAEAETAQA